MNLIWITPEFPSSESNTKGIYIYRTVKELAKYYQIYVICLYPALPPVVEMLKYWKDRYNIYKAWKANYPKIPIPPTDLSNCQIIYLRYYRLPRGKFHHLEGWFAYFQAKKYLAKIVKKDSIIHANWVLPAGTMAGIISKKYRIKFLISLLGSDVMELSAGGTFWKATKKLLIQADMVAAVSDELFDKCNELHLEVENSKKVRIDNIYEANKFIIKDKIYIREILGIDINVKVIFFAGGLEPLKNVNILIEAVFNILKSRSDVNLYLAGSGQDEGILKRLVEKLGIKEKVFFIGTLLSEDMINYYNATDVFCLPSKSEGLPNVIVESFFCGAPVVASAVGGIPSILKHSENGFLVKPGSVEDLEDKLKISLDYSWSRQAIRESISFLFPEKVIEKYHYMYKSLEGIHK